MVTRRDYTAEAVEAAKRVLIELAHRLGEYRNDVVVVGGWVPGGAFPGWRIRWTGRGRRHQRMPGIQARKARGCDLAFTAPREMRIEGELLGGRKDSVVVRVASIVPFLVMKGMALADRLKEKDPWDIYYCVRYFPGGLDALAEEFRPHMRRGLVREGLDKIAAAFASVDHVGPQSAADFDEVTDPEARALLCRDAFERIDALLVRLRPDRRSVLRKSRRRKKVSGEKV